jgi:hypothetical protein
VARIRSIKPEFWVSEQIGECSFAARLTFIGLWNFCDDNGVHPAKPKTLKAELFPMDAVSPGEVEQWIHELIAAGLVDRFESGGEVYWFVTGWTKHQRIDRPSAKHPVPPSVGSARARRASDDTPTNDCRSFDADSSNVRRASPPGLDRSGEEGRGEESPSPKSRRRTPAPQTLLPDDFNISEQVRSWARERGFGQLEEHLERFKLRAGAKGYKYANWDLAFMSAVRDDWARLRTSGTATANGEGADKTCDARPKWLQGTGFADLFAAENAGCGPGNAAKFRNGEREEA